MPTFALRTSEPDVADPSVAPSERASIAMRCAQSPQPLESRLEGRRLRSLVLDAFAHRREAAGRGTATGGRAEAAGRREVARGGTSPARMLPGDSPSGPRAKDGRLPDLILRGAGLVEYVAVKRHEIAKEAVGNLP